MPDRAHVGANLMRAAGFQPQADKGERVKLTHDGIVRACLDAVRPDRKRLRACGFL